MSLREAVDQSIEKLKAGGSIARLPKRVTLDRSVAHVLVLQRLAATRLASRGSAAGSVRASRPPGMRLDLRQRVIVKAFVGRHLGGAASGALAAHVSYLHRPGAGRGGERGVFFDQATEGVNAQAETRGWRDDRHHFRFIVSPEHGDRIPDMQAYVRDMMGRVAEDLKEPNLTWLAVAHYDTDQPHAHVLVRGKREDGRDLVIPRTYMGYGFRGRATEVAQELLGDLSRDESERRVWRETTANQYTRFDRTLLQEAEKQGGSVPDGAGRKGSYPALLRGRLAHLEALGLARWRDHSFDLAPDLELRLRALQMGGDIQRTLNQRRLEGAREVRQLGDHPIKGRVARSGYYDELGTQGYVVVQDVSGVEHYARMKVGMTNPRAGAEILLSPQARGTATWRDISRDLSL